MHCQMYGLRHASLLGYAMRIAPGPWAPPSAGAVSFLSLGCTIFLEVLFSQLPLVGAGRAPGVWCVSLSHKLRSWVIQDIVD